MINYRRGRGGPVFHCQPRAEQVAEILRAVVTLVARHRGAGAALPFARTVGAVAKLHGLHGLAVLEDVAERNETRVFATQLNLFPCFTPVGSPESNGMSEAFVKTSKRDYQRVPRVRRQNRA